MAKPVPARLTTAELRKFGLLVGTAFLVLGGIARWRDHWNTALVLWSIGGFLVVFGLLVPVVLGPVYRAWMAFALLLSKVTTPIIMGILYFVVVTPLGWILRLAGHRPLEHGKNGRAIWITRAAEARKSDMERQF